MKRKWFPMLAVAALAIIVLMPAEMAEAEVCPDCKKEIEYPSVIVTASCLKEGYYEWDCDSCMKVFRTTIPALGGHNKVHDPELDREWTCTEDGLHGWICTRCGDVSYGTILAPGHDWKAADCTHAKTCRRAGCGATEGDALGHAPVTDAAVPATCTAVGLTEGSHCSVCNAVLTAQQSIPVKGHSFTRFISNGDATCTADGTKTAACDDCNATDTIVDFGSKLGHVYKSILTKPTCTESGYATYTCSRCSDRYTARKTAQLGHRFGEWMSRGDGSHSATCLRSGCGHTNKTDCKPSQRLFNGVEFTLCPVCGETSTGEGLALMTDANALAVTSALPRGELLLRRGTLADGTEILAVAFEYAGRTEQPKGIVRIALPASALEGYTLLLQNADGTETVLTCDEADGLLSFELDFSPAQGADPVSVALLRLTPI